MKWLAGSVIVGLLGSIVLSAQSQSGPPAQTNQLTPQEQLMVDNQLAAPRLDPSVTIASLSMSNAPLGDIIAAIAKAGGITASFHSSTRNLATPAGVKLENSTVESALRNVLTPMKLMFSVTSRRTVFIYPDTPDNREKYTTSVRSFQITKADIGALGTLINRSLSSVPADELRATVVTTSASRMMFVRATPGMMAMIAKMIADNDK